MHVDTILEGPELHDSKTFACYVQASCEALIPIAQLQVRRLGPLYQSGVYFKEEPPGYESFRVPYTVAHVGYGDCAHLTVWRAAELRNAGEYARIRVKWVDPGQQGLAKIFHVQVRRADGSIEDPSTLLGMPQETIV